MKNNNWPKTVTSFIDTHKYETCIVADIPPHGIISDTKSVLTVDDVKAMINHYFNIGIDASLSAEDFVKAININLDALIGSIKDKNDTTSIMTAMMLEYTKNFINEFVETAVVKTEDKEQVDTKEDDSDSTTPVVLDQTIDLMTSADYKNRFKAEYYQLCIRLESLDYMLRRWDNDELTFTPDCPRSIYDLQIRAMKDYLAVLEARAKIEDIEL